MENMIGIKTPLQLEEFMQNHLVYTKKGDVGIFFVRHKPEQREVATKVVKRDRYPRIILNEIPLKEAFDIFAAA